ncbi:bifunctional phosphopantothenoylcysteine decarboxylase/phosphopantothenate--cysteine ligase CoaBC [Phytohalomonas tamaricis]|uniref:bifunctional phosphopantothenoylcysteine decarboxylase/phosphopantothenate--cysteine ligase CoaBC n=1 Tax=Phytohalomonas tamaricis TaxID=2081032 RepID=UPI000D0B467E|nr:bifunctional phosphopantothenoylcysteine decarboxylase/phosphopantothenate--cysteine ligase CoaBC [Phytohalomonas tamaricis]
MSRLAGKHVLLGISAGIAAYKSASLARLLKKAGAEVRVVMTEGAQAFITPLTLQALTGEAVRTSLLDPEAEAGMGHIELAKWADLILIAPATADVMARLAHGHANDLLTTLCLATQAQCVLVPAMNQAMWRHPATQANARRLAEYGWQQLGPDAGEQACGDVGSGRMLEPEAIIAALSDEPAPADLTPSHDVSGRIENDEVGLHAGRPALGLRITITAGPTREPIDPVRYLSNHSSGKMGFALAQAAAELGAAVELIAGPVMLETPPGVTRTNVESAHDMFEAAQRLAERTDIFIGCAAVADYRTETIAEHKLKKSAEHDHLTLTLVKNPDIIAAIAAREQPPFVVGFAAETRDLERYAASKLTSKRLDMIVANDVSNPSVGFGSDNNAVTLYWHEAKQLQHYSFTARPKLTLAYDVLQHVISHYRTRRAITSDHRNSDVSTPDQSQDP